MCSNMDGAAGEAWVSININVTSFPRISRLLHDMPFTLHLMATLWFQKFTATFLWHDSNTALTLFRENSVLFFILIETLFVFHWFLLVTQTLTNIFCSSLFR